MADPLSITASVAGLVSLGIQLGGGIKAYLDAVLERKEDIDSAEKQVLRMQGYLQRMEDVAAKIEPTHTTAADFLRDCAKVEPELKSLGDFVTKLSTPALSYSHHTALAKIQRHAKKLTYPFHRPTMNRLQSQLARVNTMLEATVIIGTL